MVDHFEESLARFVSQSEADPDDYWSAIDRFIAAEGPERALAASLRWCDFQRTDAQGVGLDVLGNLARADVELLPVLLERVDRLSRSESSDVRVRAAVALQHHDLDEAMRTERLALNMLTDTDADVRQAAVLALPLPFTSDVPGDHPVVIGLLQAMEDSDASVRDWATSRLGDVDVDTPEIRDAFARHLDDLGAETAGEAATALASRGDGRARQFLLHTLDQRPVPLLYVRAAEELADPSLLPALRRLDAEGWPSGDRAHEIALREAMNACAQARD